MRIVDRTLLHDPYALSSDLKRSRVPRNVLRLLGGIGTSTRPSARQAVFSCVILALDHTALQNFHPIPGTRYASLAPSGTQPPQSPSSGTDGDTFKSRMERLKDESSTNLYIEGLPLSIDEPVCAYDCPFHSHHRTFSWHNLDHGCFSGPLYDQK